MISQNPYSQPGVATGIALGVNKRDVLQPALRLLFDELSLNYYHDPFINDSCYDKTLNWWVEQGVMMINCNLTCDPFKPEGADELFKDGSHSNYWRIMLMEDLFQELNGILENIVFVFMGKKAQYYNKYIDPERHCIINVHDPVSDYKNGRELFLGCKLFSQINDYLTTVKKPIIEWKKN